jgi:hypothetical protein
VKPGDIVIAKVYGVTSSLAQIAVDDQYGVIRGESGAQLKVGQHVKAHITAMDKPHRFEATLVHVP